jgi:two-component system invasion response regulator UvrY
LINVAIADDHAIVRAGLRECLGGHPDLRVVAEASNGREAIDLLRKERIDVMVMDLSMPGQGGIDALHVMRAKAPDTGVLILSAHSAEQYAVQLLRLGASGYLEKDCDPLEVVKAVRSIAAGRRYISGQVAQLLADALHVKTSAAPHDRLTKREFQVFLKLAQGRTLGQAGADLCLAMKTVSIYRGRLMNKLDLATNSDLTYYAVKRRLIQ